MPKINNSVPMKNRRVKTGPVVAAKPEPMARKTKAAPKANSDTITSVIAARTGNATVAMAGPNAITIAPWQDIGKTRKLAVVGGSYAALAAHLATLVKPQARLATGVDAHNAPHSAKAIADQHKIAGTTGKGKARAEKAPKAKQPSRGTDRAYVLAGRKDESKPDTFRRYMLTTIMKNKTTATAKAAHAKSGKYPTHKLDFNWAAQQGYIKFTN